MLQTVWWEEQRVKLIDQTRLPQETVICTLCDYREVAQAIKTLQVRGAPAIGVTAAFGLALAAQQGVQAKLARSEFFQQLEEAATCLAQTRPTAVNLFWALGRMRQRLEQTQAQSLPPEEAAGELLDEAQTIAREDLATNRKIGAFGADLIADGDSVLTHCNAGALAATGYGTALAPIRTAREQGKRLHVYVDETRPVLQGARLTAWELQQDGIPLTLITDSMAGYFLHQGKVAAVFVGADRIAANGDVANKIGTYSVAVLAHENNVPFYVAAPRSTIDLSLATGEQIPIEERNPEEITTIRGIRIAPLDVPVANPAFDVTPARYVTAIITEAGIVYPPFPSRLAALFYQVVASNATL